MMVEDLLTALGVTIDATIAAHCYAALVFDTGRFMHNNTSAAVFRAAALSRGWSDISAINRAMTYTRSLADIQAQALAIGHLHVDEQEPRIAGMTLSLADLATVAAAEDIGEVIEIARSLLGVEVAYLLREQDDGTVRCSLRSNPPYCVRPAAEHFGGGGHDQAAGCTVAGSVVDVHAAMLSQLRAAFSVISPEK